MTPIDFNHLPETGFSEDTEKATRAYFLKEASHVDDFVKSFRSVSDDVLFNEDFLETFVLEHIGLNKESLGELAPELEPYFGTGLYIWQNPKQFANYMLWLFRHATRCQSYVEIGSRWGGTFIVTCEILRRVCPGFRCAVAADLIRKPPFIERYQEIARDSDIDIRYFQGSSTSNEFVRLVSHIKPSMTLIDGDHSLSGALKDHMMIRQFSNIIVHHDVCSDTCPDPTQLWNSLKELESGWDHVEFVEQYPSRPGNYFGIGVLSRK